MSDEWLFSNFQVVEIKHEKIIYPTVEHYYQAQKTDNIQQRVRISHLSSPVLAKRVGRTLILRKDWDDVKISVMRIGLQKKFAQEPFKTLLKEFKGEIIEFNYWHDNYWGWCQCPGCISQPHENHLGKLLMEIRDELNNR